VIQILLENDVDVNLSRLDNGVTPLMTAAVYLSECNSGLGCWMLESLLKRGANPNSQTFGSLKEGISPLMYLATADLTGCQMLAAYGGDLSAVDNDGRTVLQYAASAQHGETEEWLQSIIGFTPLQIASQIGVDHTVRWLLCQSNGGAGANPRQLTHLTSTKTSVACQPISLLEMVLQGQQTDQTNCLIKTLKAAYKVWSPTNHWLYPKQLLRQMTPLLTCALRIAANVNTNQRFTLPPELWLHIGSFMVVRPPLPEEPEDDANKVPHVPAIIIE
jgi:ankyrin repeat protein